MIRIEVWLSPWEWYWAPEVELSGGVFELCWLMLTFRINTHPKDFIHP